MSLRQQATSMARDRQDTELVSRGHLFLSRTFDDARPGNRRVLLAYREGGHRYASMTSRHLAPRSRSRRGTNHRHGASRRGCHPRGVASQPFRASERDLRTTSLATRVLIPAQALPLGPRSCIGKETPSGNGDELGTGAFLSRPRNYHHPSDVGETRSDLAALLQPAIPFGTTRVWTRFLPRGQEFQSHASVMHAGTVPLPGGDATMGQPLRHVRRAVIVSAAVRDSPRYRLLGSCITLSGDRPVPCGTGLMGRRTSPPEWCQFRPRPRVAPRPSRLSEGDSSGGSA